MTIEERLHKLGQVLAKHPEKTALAEMRAFNAEVRNDSCLAKLCLQTEAAFSLGNEAVGAIYERRAIEALHTLAKRHLCPEAVAVFDPDTAPEDANPEATPAAGDETRGNGE